MEQTGGTLRAAARDATRFDRAAVNPVAGLLAAVPVVALLGGAMAAGQRVAGLTMAAGAMLVGVAWRLSGGRPPLALMGADALVMAASTFLGSVTGPVRWLHLVVLGLWSLAGGLLAGSGNRAGVVGTQGIIAYVVFGRFGNPAPQALGLAGLVLAGGAAQVLFQSLVRWPPPLRAQRSATAAAYRKLAELARAPLETSTLPASLALDQAEESLASPMLFGDAALGRLRVLVNEGYRVRLSLSALHTLLQQGVGVDEAERRRIEAVLDHAGAQLETAGAAIEGSSVAGAAVGPGVRALEQEIAGVRAPQVGAALRSLTGQLRAVAKLAPAAGSGGGLLSRRPRGRLGERRVRMISVRDQLAALASPRSPGGRHAIRMAIVVPLAALVAGFLPLERGYWVTVAAATVMRPEYSMTFRRGIERAVGTSAGVALAGAIALGVHPGGWTAVALVGVMAWAAYALFPASFALGFAFLTALVVFLLEVVSPSTLQVAGARLLDTIIGGTFGLAAYALWPSWSEAPARQSLGELVAAVRAYLGAVLGAAVAGRVLNDREMRRLSRAARQARLRAEASVAQSLQEPARHRIDSRRSQGILSGTRRLVLAAHVLALELREGGSLGALPRLAVLAQDLQRILRPVESVARAGEPAGLRPGEDLPDLRGDLEDLQESGAVPPPERSSLLAELDELVDAANGLAVLVGLDPSRARHSGGAGRGALASRPGLRPAAPDAPPRPA